MTQTQPIQVVVAYDMTPSAELALSRAIEVVARAPQHVLHVVTALDAHHGVKRNTYRSADELHDILQQQVKAAFDGRPTAAEVQFYIHVRIGKPADVILDTARDVGADLLFIGTHNKVGLERVVLGSVSERVVREALCPVMVVRAKEYPTVDLLKVFRYEHDMPKYVQPHRYSYVETRVISRPPDWPLI